MALNLVRASDQYLIRTAVVNARPIGMVCWFKPTTLTSANVLSTCTIGSNKWNRFLHDGGGGNIVYNAISVSGSEEAAAGATVTDTNWHHFGGLWTAANLTSYVDGAGTNTTPTINPATMDRVTIGTVLVGGVSDSPFNGRIAEVAIWDLSNAAWGVNDAARKTNFEAALADIYAFNTDPLDYPGGLVGYWCRNGSANLAALLVDHSGNGSDITAVNTPTWVSDEPSGAAPSVAPTTITIDQLATTTIVASDFTGGTVTWASDATGHATVHPSTGLVTGVAHAQATNQTANITATGVSNPSQTATAVVTVRAVAVNVTPASATIGFSATKQLTGVVTGSTTTTKSWSVQSGGGSVDSGGIYTAPAGATVAVVRATSTADSARYDESTITVTDVRTVISSAPYGSAYTGDLTIGYTVYADDGSESQAFSQVDVSEIGSSGIWVAPVNVPIQFSGVVVWSVPEDSGLDPYVLEVEPFNQVTGNRGVVAIAPYGAAYTGLTIGYTMYSDDGSEFQAHTTSGVAEIGDTGIYVVGVTVPIADDLLIVWDSPSGIEPFVREIQPVNGGGGGLLIGGGFSGGFQRS